MAQALSLPPPLPDLDLMGAAAEERRAVAVEALAGYAELRVQQRMQHIGSN